MRQGRLRSPSGAFLQVVSCRMRGAAAMQWKQLAHGDGMCLDCPGRSAQHQIACSGAARRGSCMLHGTRTRTRALASLVARGVRPGVETKESNSNTGCSC